MADDREQPIETLEFIHAKTQVIGETRDHRFQIRLYLQAGSALPPPEGLGLYDKQTGLFKLYDGFKGWVFVIKNDVFIEEQPCLPY